MCEPVLLLSGAGLPVWIWDGVRASHPMAVAERPRHERASLSDYAAAAIESAPWDRFAIVAHSSGGTVAAEIVARAPERVGALLAVTAVVPEPGRSFLGSTPVPGRFLLSLAMRLAGTRPPAAAIRRTLADRLNTRTADRIVADFSPESAGLYRDRVRGGGFPERRGYLFASRDAALPLARQQRSARALGPAWTASLDTGHLPMLEAPAALARQIEDFLSVGASR